MLMFNFGYKGAGTLIYCIKAKDDVRVLLGRRLNNPDKGLWSIPGGGWEYRDSDLAETARRELREETGFELSKKNKNFLKKIWSLNLLAFKFEVFALRIKQLRLPRRSYEFSYMKWFDINVLPDPTKCNRFLYEEIDQLKRFLRNKGMSV